MLALFILIAISWVTLAYVVPRLTGGDVHISTQDPVSFLTALNYVFISGLLGSLTFAIFPAFKLLAYGKPILMLLTQTLLGAWALQLAVFLTPQSLYVKNFGAALLASGAITIVTLLVSLLLRAL